MTHDNGTFYGCGQHDPRLYAEVQISRRLSGGEDIQDVLPDVTGLLTDSLGCSWAVVLEIFPGLGRADVIFADGFADGFAGDEPLLNDAGNHAGGSEVWGTAPDASLAGYVAALQRRACAVEDIDEAPFSSPPGLRTAGVRSAVAAKVEVYGEARYVIAALYPQAISRRDPEVVGAVGLVGEISSRLSDALEKAELVGIAAFGDARQEFFLHLAGELDAAQNPDEVLRAGADACVAQLPGLPGGSAADLCVVDLVVKDDGLSGPDSPRTQVRRFYSSAALGTSEQMRHSVETVPRLSSRAGPGKVIYSGERELVEHLCPSYLRKLARDEEDLERLEQVGAHSYMALPLRSGRETIGCVGLLSANAGRRYHPGLWRSVGEFIALSISKFYAVRDLEEQCRAVPSFSEVPDVPAHYWPAGSSDPRTNIWDPPPQEPPGAGSLTGRQYEVLALLDEGLSHKGMAQRLHLSKGTVQNHCSGLYRSLGANSQVEALAIARQLGLLSR